MTTILAFLLFSLMVPLSNVTGDAIKLSQEKCEEFPERVCPACGSRHLIKNGSVGKSKPKCQGKSCGRQFVDNPTKTTISSTTKQLIDKLLRAYFR